jgi:hypothetical protein
MAYSPDKVPAALEAAIRDMFGGIDHVNVERVHWAQAGRGSHPVAITDESYSIIARVKGWSPSLHRAVIDYEADLAALAESLSTKVARRKALADMQLDSPLGVATLVTLAHEGFPSDASEQRERAGHAARLGIHRPRTMAKPGSVSDGRRIAVGHLLVDRSAAEVLRTECGGDVADPCPRRTIEHAVATAHHRAVCFDVEAYVYGSVLDRVSMHSHLHGPTVDLGIEIGGGARITGDILIVDRQLPDTILAACAGRALSDLVAARPEFGGRTIESVRTWADTTRIKLVPDMVRVDEAFPPRSARRTRRRGECT